MAKVLIMLFALNMPSFAQLNEFGGIDIANSPSIETPQPRMQVEDFSDEESKGALDSLSGVKLKPNSYGVTIYQGETETGFRKISEAQTFIRTVPAKSVTLAIYYGHGSPGMMLLGEDTLIAGQVIDMLNGKLADGSAVHLFGCNTAAIPSGGISINPLKGLSYLARRILYYQGARIAGASKEDSEAMWNEDMAYDVSKGLKDVEVCGLATFGLVPGRLVGKETIKPGLVLGQWVCYKNRKQISSSK